MAASLCLALMPPVHPLLSAVLLHAVRRYRVPALPASLDAARERGPATALAVAIEQARVTLAAGGTPGEDCRALFLASLARLIVQALGVDEDGDPAFQAMVLRHRSPIVREHASLAAHAERDRRQIRSIVNALAHPAKAQRRAPGEAREALARLHAATVAGDWTLVVDVATRLVALPEVHAEPALHRGIERLLDDEAFTRLRRIDALSTDPLVARYRALWDQRGPSAGTERAAELGDSAQRRGDAVEVLATEALEALVQRMNAGEGAARYRVATSLRVPSAIPGDPQRAKSEWDVALLRRRDIDRIDEIPGTGTGTGKGTGSTSSVEASWDLCLLVEAKASADAATTDLPRLVRGLRLLAQADVDTLYPFAAREGEVLLSGASLAALPTEEGDLSRAVLYCCDGPEDHRPRPLNAASRMQLLSASASLAHAARIEDGLGVEPELLDPVWRQLLESPAFTPVLRQYPTLRAVRALMLHPDDLMAAAQAESGPT